jgi:hypothetical protein
MKTWNLVRIGGGAIAAFVLLSTTQAKAIVAFDFPVVNGNQVGSVPNLSLAEGFSVSASGGVMVDALGAYNNPANSSAFSAGSVTVAIYTLDGFDANNNPTSGSLVVNPVAFSQAVPGTQIASTSTYQKTITPVFLPFGNYMIVASGYGDGSTSGERNWNHASAGSPPFATTDPGITGLLTFGTEGIFGLNFTNASNLTFGSSFSSGVWSYDNANGTHVPGYMAGNFDFTPVPEVTAYGAAAVGLLGLVYIGRYVGLRRKVKLG